MGTRGSNCCYAHPNAVIWVLHKQGQGQTCPSKTGNVEGVPVVFWGVKGSARLESCWAGFGDGELTIITITIAIAITITIFSVNIFSFKQHLWSFASWGSKKLCLPAAWHWEQSLTPLPKKKPRYEKVRTEKSSLGPARIAKSFCCLWISSPLTCSIFYKGGLWVNSRG